MLSLLTWALSSKDWVEFSLALAQPEFNHASDRLRARDLVTEFSTEARHSLLGSAVMGSAGAWTCSAPAKVSSAFNISSPDVVQRTILSVPRRSTLSSTGAALFSHLNGTWFCGQIWYPTRIVSGGFNWHLSWYPSSAFSTICLAFIEFSKSEFTLSGLVAVGAG